MTRSSVIRHGRRVLTWVLVALYSIIASGLPLPLAVTAPAPGSPAARRLAEKDRSQPFPCMDKPCGCATAEQCFTNCCCHTPAETLAWARANRASPAVLAALARRVAATGQTRKATMSCCSPQANPAGRVPPTSCCEPTASDATGEEVCRDYQSLAADPAAATPESSAGDHSPRTARTVVLKAMLACGGTAAEWMAAGIALPPPPPMTWEFGPVPITSLRIVDVVVACHITIPDAPPPRV